MPTIQENLELFIRSLERNIPIHCDKNGYWEEEGTCRKVNRMLTCDRNEVNRLVVLGQAFCKELDTLERSPVGFNSDSKIECKQAFNFIAYLKAAKAVQNQLMISPSPKVKAQLDALKHRIVGLKYRIEAANGGLDPQVIIEQPKFIHLLKLAQEWKNSQPLYPDKDKPLTLRDINKIQQVCQYPDFIDILFKDKRYKEIFFKWCIRDNNGVGQFVEFPAISARLRASFLDKRIGYLSPNDLSIRKIKNDFGIKEKVICLPFFDGKKTTQVSILDESRQVELTGGWNLTIREIFDIFSGKSISPGNLEYFGPTGINNWCNHEIGWWNHKTKSYVRPNFDLPEWWKQLPIFQILSKEEVERRNLIIFKKGDWIRSINSTRESLDFGLLGSHGYLEIAIPFENGQYGIYPFGKYAASFPIKKLDQLRLVTQTVKAKIGYPDENPVYSQRQHASHSIQKNRDQGIKMLEEIKKDIQKSIEGNLTFQLSGENCAHWAQTKLEMTEGETTLNPFKMPLVKMNPTHPILTALIDIPTIFEPYFHLQPFIMSCFSFFANRNGINILENGEKVYKVTSFASNYSEQYQYQPDLLPREIEEEKLQGSISYGN